MLFVNEFYIVYLYLFYFDEIYDRLEILNEKKKKKNLYGGNFGKVGKLYRDFPKIRKVPTRYKNAVGGDFWRVLAPQAVNFYEIFQEKFPTSKLAGADTVRAYVVY